MPEQPAVLADEIVLELRAAVGAEHVLTSAPDLDRYSRCTIPWQSWCSAVVFPNNTGEVAEVVKIAAKYKVALWPFSGGRNWGYGATLAVDSGAIVMILERMNRVLEVNEELAYAVIEPGVTYEQLNAHLKEQGYKLWMDCIDGTPKGSVIGNALDRGVGETPYGDHFGNLCGLEVVLPNGEKASIGGDSGQLKTWHTHKWGVGPYLEGLFSQSNMGIVTRAGIWLMPQPAAYNSFVFEIKDEANLPYVLEGFRQLALQGIITAKLHMINDVVSFTLLTQCAAEQVASQGPMSDDDTARLRSKYRVSPWSCGGGVYGTAAQVRLQRSLLRKSVGRYGKLLFLSDSRVKLVKRLIDWSKRNTSIRLISEALLGTSLPVMEFAPYVHGILQGIPTEYFVKHAYFRHSQPRPNSDINPARDNCGLTWFAPILPLTRQDVMPFLDACKQRFSAYGFDFYVAMLMMNPRSIICLMAIMYDKANTEQCQQASVLYDELMYVMQESGYQQYRSALSGWHRLFDRAPELLGLNNKLKAALDPDNILAPGRYGIDGQLTR